MTIHCSSLRNTDNMFSTTAVLFVSFNLLKTVSTHNYDFRTLLPSVKFRISEYPPILNSSVDARSVAVFNDTKSYSLFELALDRLTNHPSKLYIEVHPSTILEFISFLNITTMYIHDVLWTPCFMLYWPEIVTSSKVAEAIILQIVDKIDKNNFPLSSEIYVGFDTVYAGVNGINNDTRNKSSQTVIYCELFKHKRDQTLTSQFCHVRSLVEHSSLSAEEYLLYHPVSKMRRDFDGKTLNIIAQYDPSYEERLSLREFENGTVDYTGGMCLELLIALQIAMNFSYVPLKGNGWVGLLPNGTWSGMVAQLINDEADLSIAQASMIMMINTLSGVSFLHPTSMGQFVALFKQPSSSTNLSISAFSTNCWIFYFLTWITVILSLYCVYNCHKRTTYKYVNEIDIFFIREGIMWALATTCGKGWHIQPSNMCLRTITLMASIMAFCTYAAYSSQLTVILVTEVLPIRNFKELALSNLEIFTDKWLPVARSLIEKVYSQRGVEIPLRNSELYTVEEGLSRVIKEDSSLAFVTFVDAITSVYYKMNLTDNYVCEMISSVGLASQRTPTAMFVKRSSPLKEILNYNILNLAQKGIIKRLNNQYQERTEILCRPNPNNYRGGLNFSDIWTPFMVLATGFILCILSLILETLYIKPILLLN